MKTRYESVFFFLFQSQILLYYLFVYLSIVVARALPKLTTIQFDKRYVYTKKFDIKRYVYFSSTSFSLLGQC